MKGDQLLNAAVVGECLAGKSERTGRRFMDAGHVPVYLIGGKRYVRKSELDAWIDQQRFEPVRQQATDLKSMLTLISDRVLSQRRKMLA